MTGLPQGWTETALGDVCELLNGRAYSQPELLSKGKYPVLRVGNLFSRNAWYHSDLELDPDKYIDSGDLIYAWSASFGPRIWQGGKVIYHYHIWKCALQDQAVDKHFLYNLLLWDTAKIKGDHGVGSTMMHVTKSAMEKRQIPLPPLPEQRRIVRKLDTLGARSTTARTHLTAIEKLVDRYKRGVMLAAFRGDLTKEWRRNLEPDDWKHLRASEVCEIVQSGGTPSKDCFLTEGGIPFLKVYNIVNQQIDFAYRPQFITPEAHHTVSRKSKIKPRDVLMNIVGPPLGKIAIVPDDFPEWNCNQAITIFRPSDLTSPEWIYYFLNSGTSVSSVIRETRGVVGQVNISLSQCRDFIIPIPPLNEQHEIVRHIETAFAKIDRLAAEAAKALKLLGHLDQRILAKAFAGNLVPQDPTDEPAETLLARIRETRAAAPKSRRGRK